MKLNDLHAETKILLEYAKGKIYEEYYSLHPGKEKELNQLDFNNFLVIQLAMQSIVITSLNRTVSIILKKLGGLQNEGDEQTNATQTTQGSNDTSTDNVGV